jgi:hypothetical protein
MLSDPKKNSWHFTVTKRSGKKRLLVLHSNKKKR